MIGKSAKGVIKMTDKSIDSNKKIDNQTMDNIEILAKLELSTDERKKAMDEMEKILSYVDKLNELSTDEVEPLVHIMPDANVFREDCFKESHSVELTLSNAPAKRDNMFVVPKTV